MSLPTVEQVREHAERHPLPRGGGAWLARGADKNPSLISLRTDGTRVLALLERGTWMPLTAPIWEDTTWTPCDREGNPLPLVQELASLRERCAELPYLHELVDHPYAPTPGSGSSVCNEECRACLLRVDALTALASTDPNPGR